MADKVRVRFAPSPTGFMHIGNVRAALMNYLFAHQKKGTLVLRIEDTDESRNLDEAGFNILKTLKWLSLKYDEGPIIGGDYGPYLQSERTKKYKKLLHDLIKNQLVYRCFCTKEELEEKRKNQIAQGMPPRYDRTCRNLPTDKVKEKLANKLPFIWRFKLNDEAAYEINTLERGIIKFEMKNFSDFAITRQNGSFTFLFTNFVDDYLMQITHVIRGEDHLTNTAMQAALFYAFAFPLPKFWHLPIICNVDGKKLSKRDFGFGVQELREEGFLPQAILNYLAILGTSFEDEIQSLGQLVENYNFDKISSTGSIKFDIEKLKWINHKWIEKLPANKLLEFTKPFLHDQIPSSIEVDDNKLEFILEKIKTDLKTLKDIGAVISFYFYDPVVDIVALEKHFGKDKAITALKLIKENINMSNKTDMFLETVKKEAKNRGLKIKEIFGTLRYLLIGSFSGISMYDLFEILPDEVILKRLKKLSG
ncbi:glutamate--tRNA ligase [Candidatus Dependentiae bacterium]|nr:glutamate--tRNA ligase [Candidatus Dependentiae bacterium]